MNQIKTFIKIKQNNVTYVLQDELLALLVGLEMVKYFNLISLLVESASLCVVKEVLLQDLSLCELGGIVLDSVQIYKEYQEYLISHTPKSANRFAQNIVKLPYNVGEK